MALPADLEKVLGYIPESEREARRKELTELHENGLRQSEFSRKMNELAEQEKIRKAAYDEGKQWVEQNRTYYREALAQRDAAQQRLKDLETAAKAPPKPDDIPTDGIDDPAIAGAIRQARAEAQAAQRLLQEQAEKVQSIQKMLDEGQLLTRKQFEEEGVARLQSWSAAQFDVTDKLNQAMQEFGKPIERTKLLEAAARYNGDLKAAYEAVTSDYRIDKIKEDVRKEVAAEYEAKMRNNAVPLSSGPAPSELGPLQARVLQATLPGESKIDPNIPVDQSGRLAYAMAQELRAEGKF